MGNTSINPFEYVSILVSLILGLGITQILSAFGELLYDHKKVKFYWPHTLWIFFIVFLHLQDWFITYQLKDKSSWNLPELFFILLYPVTLFLAAKLLLPTNSHEESIDMKKFYQSQYPILMAVISVAVFISICFNVLLLHNSLLQQIPLIIFLAFLLFMTFRKPTQDWIHQCLSLLVTLASLISIFIEKDNWVIK